MSRFFRGKFSRHFHEASRSREKGSDDRKIWIVGFNITSCGAQIWRQQSGQLSHSVHVNCTLRSFCTLLWLIDK